MTDTSHTLIDLICVNNEHCIVKSGVVLVTLSDHFLVFCIIKVGVSNKAQPRIFKYHSYKTFDLNKFNSDLQNVPWHIIENENDVDDALFIWNNLFSEAADDHALIKRQRVKDCQFRG